MPSYRPEAERFWEKVQQGSDEECWQWLAGLSSTGYGIFHLEGRVMTFAHRWAYAAGSGESIGDGLHVDHKCHNRACVNPNHLRLLTPAQNTENHSGPTRANKSGYRGVYFEARTQRWVAQFRHPTHGLMKRFDRIEDAAAAVRAHRNQVLTFNDVDRAS